ncbi:uncharacterized protein BCR38DRAFT_439444 [Pseudomassariella vexata]|uniref:CID domain-containing protein n=1 Tax=Pseudomassariella vexata TaxID=1141098 RepID=A0A1Y2DTR6_9PEZI|nr:uncharacterized protein BCR38DRAFT_439444 [Pseudomassariella vexata]ORY62673.1 hypothetical protein BCR38DRAFT_439444 [Pseudomassariella vexata]
MSSNKLPDFPNVEAKLQKPSKQSAFEKERAEREAKRKREAAETAAVYESFVKSFDRDEDEDEDEISAIARGSSRFGGRGGGTLGGLPGRGGGAFGGSSAPGKRHFGAAGGMKSGPGSLGPPPLSYGRKRGFDGGLQGQNQRDFGRRDEGRGRLGFQEEERERDGLKDRDCDAPPSRLISKAFNTSDDEGDARATDRAEERAVAKPTLRLSNLPPGTSPAVIKALIPPNLTVESVKLLPPGAPGVNERKSMTAILVLSQDTPATDIDAAVSSLQNRYLGYGFNLLLHRHLSSAVTTTVAATLSSATASQPFGAKPVAQTNDHQPAQFHRGFAPPSSYGPPGGPIQRTILHVPVQAPRDIKQLQLIHKVVESILEHGPEFEALLMSRPEVQREEKWAWLWDARSEGGVWYRWRLWEVITGSQSRDGKQQGKYLPLFEGSHAWKTPEKPLAYEYTTNIDEFVSDPEYNSSDEEDFEDDGNKHAEGGPGGDNESAYLNPFDKAKLAHLLARLPNTLGRIRKGDIARVTTFAITHASRGAGEIVDMIVSNIERPFSLTFANPEYKPNSKGEDNGQSPPNGDSNTSTPLPEDAGAAAKANEPEDTSASSLVGLYIVSDILSSSATSGVRHSWRFRQLFETSLRERKVFEHLGRTAERLNWGRLRAEKWKRSVGLVLGLWEGWCVFPAESQELFAKSFESPPSSNSSTAATTATIKKDDSMKQSEVETKEKKAGGRWKPVETGAGIDAAAGGGGGGGAGQRGFKPVEAVADGGGFDPSRETKVGGVDVDDGEPMDEDVDLNLGDEDELMDEDIDGVPMSEDEEGWERGHEDLDGDKMDEDPPPPPPLLLPSPPPPPVADEEGNASVSAPQEVGKPSITGVGVGSSVGGGDGDLTEAGPRPRRRLRAVDMFADSDASDEGGK